MRLSRRSIHAVLVLLIVGGGIAPVLARKKPKPEPCPEARYLVSGEPLIAGDTTPDAHALTVGRLDISLDDLCTSVVPKPYTATRAGITNVHGKWLVCPPLAGKVKLVGKITDGCTHFTGTLKAKKFKHKFDAVRSTCGDHIVDHNGGEQCDDGNTIPGDGCENDCRETPTSTTTTEPGATTTTVPGATTTTVVTVTTSTSIRVTTSTIVGATTTSTVRPTTTSTLTSSTVTTVTTTSSTSSSTVTTTTTTSTTLPPPDLHLAMIANPDPVAPGALLTYWITVTNHGPGPASVVEVRMPIPAGLASSTLGCRSASDGGAIPVGCLTGQEIAWSLGGLDVGESRSVEFVAGAGNVADGTVIAATARVTESTGTEHDASASVTVTSTGPLSLLVATDADPAAFGETVEYVLRFGNRGTIPRLSTTLALALPDGSTGVDAGGASVASGVATWTIGTFNAAQTSERRLKVTFDDLGVDEPHVRVAQATLTTTTATAHAAALTKVEATPRLAVALSATPEPAALGNLVTWTLTVSNRSATDATAVVLAMPVPEGLYSTSGCALATDGGAFPALCFAGRDTTWNLGTLAGASSRTVQFVGVIAPTNLVDGTLIAADARATDAEGDTAHAGTITTIASAAPLELTLAGDADPVAVGDTLEYVMRFSNVRTTPLLTTALALTLPPGVTVLDAGGATVAGGTATWAIGTFDKNQTDERRLRVQVDDLGAAEKFVRIARAQITSGNVAARAVEATQVKAATPLVLTMTATPDPVSMNDLITYTLTVANRGPVDAAGVVLSLPVPQGLYSTSGCRAVTDDGTFPGACAAGHDVTWNLGTLAKGATRSVQFVGLVTAAGLPDGTLVNASARVADVAGDVAHATTSTVVLAAPALAVALDDEKTPAGVDYVVRFGNTGTVARPSTSLVLALGPGETILDADGAAVDGATVTWALGTLDVGQAGEHRVRVQIDSLGASDPHIRRAHAALTSGVQAARAAKVTQLDIGSPLGLTMVATPDPVPLGGLVTYTLTVSNHSADESAGVILRMPVPLGLYGTSGCRAVTDGGAVPAGCYAGLDIVWDLGNLAAGASRTVQFVGLVTVSGLPNGSLVEATARVADVVGNSARAGLATILETTGPLNLTLDDGADPVAVGDTLTYVLHYGNRGTAVLPSTSLALTVPPGTSVTDDGGATLTGSTATWDLGTLAAGAAGKRQLTVHIDDIGDDEPRVRRARAVVASGIVAAWAAEATQVETGATLALTISVSPDPAALNGTPIWSLKMTNNGAIDSAGVILDMPVPAGLYGTSGCKAFSDGGVKPPGCTAGLDIEWDIGPLAAGASKTVTFTGQVPPTAVPNGTLLRATARVSDVAGARARAAVTAVVHTGP